jgi:group I intron endonuclease
MGTKIGIYKFTNPKGKSYIGQAVDIERRHQMYKQLNKDSVGPKFLNSLKKYGYGKHKMEILEECSLEQLDEKEFFWKKKFIDEKGWDNALFFRLKDKKGGKHSLDTINKMRKAKLGKKYSDESKQKMKKPKTEEHKQKISESKKGKENLKSRKKVGQYDKEENLIKIWEKTKQAEKELRLWNGGVSACINGRQKECGGFIWKRID